jgi:hypothetical protein
MLPMPIPILFLPLIIDPAWFICVVVRGRQMGFDRRRQAAG